MDEKPPKTLFYPTREKFLDLGTRTVLHSGPSRPLS